MVAQRTATYLLFLACLLVFPAQPSWAVLPTPDQPVLVVQDSGSADPYQNFVVELLTTEGLNSFQTAQLAEVTAAFLANYDVVLLPHLTLTPGQAALFQDYVSAGGTLIGFRPDLQLATVFGVASLGSTLSEAWLQIDAGTPYTSSLESPPMRFHGAADLYSLSGAAPLAALYNNPGAPTAFPAAAIHTFGSGKAILFSFDLAQSIVLMRQGNPAWAGYPNTHDGFFTMQPSQMFMDVDSGQFWNDLGDGALNDVPQADIQMRLLSNALMLSNTAKRPLPRFWYFPSQNRSLLLLTGDQHGELAGFSTNAIDIVQSYGGKFTEFLWYPFGSIGSADVNDWLSAGHGVGIHFDDTAELDSSGVGGSAATWNGMQNVLTSALDSFAATYPGAPYPNTTRVHLHIWVSRNAAGAPDQTAQAKLLRDAGIELDMTYSAYPNRWGYMTGSGLPMKFLDTATGEVIPVYEQLTHYQDDIQLGDSAFSLQWDLPTAQDHYTRTLSESLTKYNTVVNMLFHPERWDLYSLHAQTVLEYAQSNSIPMYTAPAWLQFWKARAATGIGNVLFSANTLTFTATNAPEGLTLQVPHASGNDKVVSAFQVDGVPQAFSVDAYQGVMYASVNLTAGTHNVSVTYTPAGGISGLISPSAAAASTTVQIQGPSIAQTVPLAPDGTYAIGPLPAGNYTVTPSSAGFLFSPASRLVTVGSAYVTNVDFIGTSQSTGQTLFTTQTPSVPNDTDGPEEELGMKFTSTVAGQITAIRFWKAGNESGAHTGRIWSSTGQLLASVAFTSETASGWQQQALLTPLSIAANTQYVVSVNSTFFVISPSGLASQVANGNLRSVVGNNGVFGTAGQFPTSSFQNSNYFRDIVFVGGTTYSISGNISPAASGSGATVTLSGAAGATTTADASGNYSFSGLVNGSYTVTPGKSGFTFSPTNAPATISNANVTGISFTATAASGQTLFTTQTPVVANDTDGIAEELGMKFTSTASGQITAIRFWKAGNENGTHTGRIWSSTGQLLASATFAGETASGWQQQALLTPLAIAANTPYVVSVNSTFFVISQNGLASQVANGNLRSVVGSNGVWGFAGQFPANSFQNSNYFRDIVFVAAAGTTYSISGNISPVAGGSGATVTLSGAAGATTTADGSGNYSFSGLSNGSYTVTPGKSGFTFAPASAPVTVSNAGVTGVNFTATAAPAAQTLFTTQTPLVPNDTDGPPEELGMKFTSTVAGQITAIRFWKAGNESGAHTGRIWSSTGQLLASVAFANETASGWQQQALLAPLAIAANTPYVVSVNSTFFVISQNGLASQVANGNLRSVVGSNGVFGTAGQFPTASFQNSNYFRDVVFVAGAGTTPTAHYEYVVLYNDGMYVYDIDNDFQLVKHVPIPTPGEVQGVAAAPATHMLYVSCGGNGGSAGTGSLVKLDLLTDTVVWTRSYPFGVDSFAVTPDGATIYMPSGDASGDGFWYIIDAVTGDVTGSIDSGMLGPHNTIVSLDDAHLFLGPLQSNFLVDVSRSTNTVIRNIGPLNEGVRPFTINGKNTLAFTTGSFYFGFQVSSITTGDVLYTVPIPDFSIPPGFDAMANHGISLSPDEKEIYLLDGANFYVHVFDVSGLPAVAPTLLAHIPLTGTFSDSEIPCPYSFCPQEGWLQHTRDGRFVIVGNSGDIVDTATRAVVKTLLPLVHTRKHIEIHWQNGLPVFTTTRYGLGYVTQ